MIGGFQKQSLIDYPGHISSMIFTRGCNLRCHYCHNPQLVYSYLFDNEVPEENAVFEYLNKNSELLDAVVITGGEPTLHPRLPDLIARVKSLGLKVKLDTNGTNPEMLTSLLLDRKIDFVAMDVKAPFVLRKSREIAGDFIQKDDLDQIRKSIKVLSGSDVDHEFRTTISYLLCKEDLRSIMEEVHGKLYLQRVMATSEAIRFIPAASKEDLDELVRESNDRLQVALRGY